MEERKRAPRRNPERSEMARLMTAAQGQAYTNKGRDAFRAFADEIGATRHFGARMVRFDRKVIDAALDALPAENAAEKPRLV